MKSRMIWILVLLGAGLLLAGCQDGENATEGAEATVPVVVDSFEVIAEGRVVPQEYVNLSFTAGGQVGEVLVSEGEGVSEGQALARLDNSEQLASAVAGAEMELLNAQLAYDDLVENADMTTAQALQAVADARDAVRDAERYLNNLNAGGRQTDIDKASAEVVILQDKLREAGEDFQGWRNKPEDNVDRAEYQSKLADAQRKYDDAVLLLNNLEGSPSELDLAIAEADLALAEARLLTAEKDYEEVQDGPDPDEVAKAEARLKAAETGLEAAQAALADAELSAPFEGTVVDVDLKEGEQVGPGQVVVVLADFTSWVVETDNLTEIEVPDVSVGQAVSITPDALPELELSGTVETISDLYEEKRGDVTYTVKITLDETDPRLRWGMTVVVTFKEE